MCSYIYIEIDIDIYIYIYHIYTCNIYVSYHDVVNDEKIKIITTFGTSLIFYVRAYIKFKKWKVDPIGYIFNLFKYLK